VTKLAHINNFGQNIGRQFRAYLYSITQYSVCQYAHLHSAK